MVQLPITFLALNGQPESLGSAAAMPYARKGEHAFRLPCLEHACDAAAGVRPMTPLFHP
jgi:hypothetical protein